MDFNPNISTKCQEFKTEMKQVHTSNNAESQKKQKNEIKEIKERAFKWLATATGSNQQKSNFKEELNQTAKQLQEEDTRALFSSMRQSNSSNIEGPNSDRSISPETETSTWEKTKAVFSKYSGKVSNWWSNPPKHD